MSVVLAILLPVVFTTARFLILHTLIHYTIWGGIQSLYQNSTDQGEREIGARSPVRFVARRKLLFNDLEIVGIRNAKAFKTFLTVMNYGHGDTDVAHKVCIFVTDCISLQSG